MIRLSKLTDYGIVLLAHFAIRAQSTTLSAAELSRNSHVPRPTVSKILKMLAHANIVTSQRGAKGGYSLSRPAEEIRVGQVIEALDGPIALTDCCNSCGDPRAACDLEFACPVRVNWRRINLAIRSALDQIPLTDMVRGNPPFRFVAPPIIPSRENEQASAPTPYKSKRSKPIAVGGA